MAATAGDGSPFDASLGPAGGRLGGRRGGVAWLQVIAGAIEVARLAEQLDAGLPGLRAGAINRPHLTVARGVDDETLGDLRASGAAAGLRWTVDRIVLFRSHTGPRGSSYELVAEALLEGGTTAA